MAGLYDYKKVLERVTRRAVHLLYMIGVGSDNIRFAIRVPKWRRVVSREIEMYCIGPRFFVICILTIEYYLFHNISDELVNAMKAITVIRTLSHLALLFAA